MEIQEALKEIQKVPKHYLHIGMSQGTYSNTIRHIEAGIAKQSTIEEFFGKFGYEVDIKMKVKPKKKEEV